MPKPRKKTDTVQLKLRLRETLRHSLEVQAKRNDRSLNSEIVARLERSFLQSENMTLLQAMFGGGDDLEFLRAVSAVIRAAGPDWPSPEKAKQVAGAMGKLVGMFSGSIPPVEDVFPNREVSGSSDQLAWLAVLLTRFHVAMKHQLHGDAT